MEDKKLKTINTDLGMKFVVGLEHPAPIAPDRRRIIFDNLELDDDITKSTSDKTSGSSSKGFANYLFLGTLVFLIVSITLFLILK